MMAKKAKKKTAKKKDPWGPWEWTSKRGKAEERRNNETGEVQYR